MDGRAVLWRALATSHRPGGCHLEPISSEHIRSAQLLTHHAAQVAIRTVSHALEAFDDDGSADAAAVSVLTVRGRVDPCIWLRYDCLRYSSGCTARDELLWTQAVPRQRTGLSSH